jgi:hypothetical protein
MVGDCRDSKAGGNPLFAGFLMLDAPLLGEQRHGTHQVLHADDADDAAALSDGNKREAVSGGDTADGGAERIFGFGYLEGTRHHRLHVAVAVIAECVDDPLTGDDADELRSAHDGEVFLQGVNAAHQGICQSVGRGERSEVSKHNFAHVHGVDHGLEEDTLILNLRGDHDEEAGDDEPGGMQQHTADHGCQGQKLAKAGGGAACGRESMLEGEAATKQTAEIERVGRQEVQNAEAGLHPNHAAQEPGSGNPRMGEEADVSSGANEGGGQHESRGAIGDGAGKGHGELAEALVGVFLAFGIGVGKEAADGKEEDGAKAKVEVGRRDEARRFADNDGDDEHHEQAEAAQPSVRGAEAETHHREQWEKGVDAHLDAHPPAQRDCPAPHT